MLFSHARSFLSFLYAISFYCALTFSPLTSVSASQTTSVSKTIIAWSRSIVTCDTNGVDNAITIGTSKIVYSYSGVNPGTSGTIPYHDTRGQQSVDLLSPQDYMAAPVRESDSTPLILQISPSFNVPPGTFYYCQGFQLPMNASKLHVIESEPMIDNSLNGIVHHILIWTCATLTSSDLQYRGDCNTAPNNLRSCQSSVMAGWAVGQGPAYYPKQAGLPIGGINKAHEFVMMQIHYNNPKGVVIADSTSSYRFWITAQLRPNDAGIINMNHDINDLLVPPQRNDVLYQAWVSPSCTTAKFPSSGITVFSNFLHSHLLGTNMSVQHFRLGVELTPIELNPSYDFNFQATRSLSPFSTVLPGDDLLLNCNYNSMSKTTYVPGGDATTNEMCMSFLYYYPAVDLGQSSTSGAFPQFTSSCSGLTTASFPTVGAPLITSPLPTLSTTCVATPSLSTQGQSVSAFGGTVAQTNLAAQNLNTSTYAAHLVLDSVGNYVLHWTPDVTNGVIHFAAEVVTTGWVGFGISQTGDMTTSDIMLGWVSSGNVTVGDRFAFQHALPPLDVQQDLYAINGVIASYPVVNYVDPIYGTQSVQSSPIVFTPPADTPAASIPGPTPFVPSNLSFSVSVTSFSDVGCNARTSNVKAQNGACTLLSAGAVSYYVLPLCASSSAQSAYQLTVYTSSTCSASSALSLPISGLSQLCAAGQTTTSPSANFGAMVDCSGGLPLTVSVGSYTNPTCAQDATTSYFSLLSGACYGSSPTFAQFQCYSASSLSAFQVSVHRDASCQSTSLASSSSLSSSLTSASSSSTCLTISSTQSYRIDCASNGALPPTSAPTVTPPSPSSVPNTNVAVSLIAGACASSSFVVTAQPVSNGVCTVLTAIVGGQSYSLSVQPSCPSSSNSTTFHAMIGSACSSLSPYQAVYQVSGVCTPAQTTLGTIGIIVDCTNGGNNPTTPTSAPTTSTSSTTVPTTQSASGSSSTTTTNAPTSATVTTKPTTPNKSKAGSHSAPGLLVILLVIMYGLCFSML